MSQERVKDRLFGFRTTVKNKDSKGRDMLSVYLNKEDIQDMIDILTANINNEKGIKFVLHTGQKENSETGHKFDSTFGFVKAVENKVGGGVGKGTFTPKATASKAAATLNSRAS